MKQYVDLKLTNEKTKSFIGGNYISSKILDTKLDFICQLDLKELNIEGLPKDGILYFFYDLDNNINYDLNNKSKCLVYYEDKFFKFEHKTNNIPKSYLTTTNDNFDVRLLGDAITIDGDHRLSIELLDRRYDLSKSPFILPYVKEDAKEKCGEWILLLQVRSNDIIKIGDMGNLCYYIRKNDLKNLNFTNVYCIKESY